MYYRVNLLFPLSHHHFHLPDCNGRGPLALSVIAGDVEVPGCVGLFDCEELRDDVEGVLEGACVAVALLRVAVQDGVPAELAASDAPLLHCVLELCGATPSAAEAVLLQVALALPQPLCGKTHYGTLVATVYSTK